MPVKNSLAYRTEIDGLRAIAVFAVIFYHAGLIFKGHRFFDGGFIGVDIFFVISGYLITSLLLREMHEGKFSFLKFYERRVRRILPALFAVMIASLPFGLVFFVERSFEDFTASITTSLLFVSNLYFWMSGEAYAAESSLLRPFLHTWSLSVEEQYYILFPILLLFCFRHFRKHLMTILILGLLVSLGMADWGSRNYPSFNFYALPTRGWELLAGSLLAKWETDFGRLQHQILTPVMPFVGLMLIIYSIVFFDDRMFHPSLYSLYPIAGTMLIVWYCRKGEIITEMLSSKLFVGSGLISYSLYLWHYPVFAFARINESFARTNGVTQFSKILFIIVILSVLTYFFIERPFRKRGLFSTKRVFVTLASAGFVLFFSALYLKEIHVVGISGVSKGSSDPLYNLYRTPKDKLCDFKIEGFCSFNNNGKIGSVFLVGDSHMQSIQEPLRKSLVRDDFNLITLAMGGGCVYNPNFNLVDRKTKKITGCDLKAQEKRRQLIFSKPDSVVVLGGRFPLYLSEHGFNNLEGGVEQGPAYIFNNEESDNRGGLWRTYYDPVGLSVSLQQQRKELISKNIIASTYELLNKGHRVILVYPIPEVGWEVLTKLRSMAWRRLSIFSTRIKLSDYKITTSYDVYKDRVRDSFQMLDSIQHPNLSRVYPHKLFCDKQIKNRCIANGDTNVYYSDNNHMSIKGSEMIVELIINEIMRNMS